MALMTLGFSILWNTLNKKNIETFWTTNSLIIIMFGLCIIVVLIWLIYVFGIMSLYGIYARNKVRVGYDKIKKSVGVMYNWIWVVVIMITSVGIAGFLSESLVELLSKFFIGYDASLFKIILALIFLFPILWLLSRIKKWVEDYGKKISSKSRKATRGF